MMAVELGQDNHRTLRETKNYRAWVRLMRDGLPTEPRFMHLAAPPEPGSRFERVVAMARNRHMVRRSIVETEVADFLD